MKVPFDIARYVMRITNPLEIIELKTIVDNQIEKMKGDDRHEA